MHARIFGHVLLGLVFAVAIAHGDEQDKAKDSKATADFAAAKADWEKFTKELQSIATEYRTANEETQKELAKKYEEATKKAPEILKRVRSSAVAAYKESPNTDKDVTSALVGLLASDVQRDDYEAALDLARLLIENKTDNYHVYNLAGIAAYGVDDFAQAEEWLKVAQENETLTQTSALFLEDAPAAQKRFAKEEKIREKEKAADDLPRVRMETNRGVLVIELFENEAPDTVGNFVSLVEKGFYNGLTFHRVLPGFMAQGGDPEGTGGGGPGYDIYCECGKPEHREHFRGTLSMAHAGKDTGGSQFFLTFRATEHLDGKHTAFGRVIEGLDLLTKLQRRDPNAVNPPEPDKIVKAEVIRKRDHAYKPRKVE